MHLKVFLDLKSVSIKTTSIAKEKFFSKKKIHLYSIPNQHIKPKSAVKGLVTRALY